jgi:UbiD family decarboxylase
LTASSPVFKTVLPHADFIIEGYAGPRERCARKALAGDHTGYYTVPDPYSVFHITALSSFLFFDPNLFY